ncbi:TauD/TfdA family dioxygenase [Streptomyces sp. NPDC053048]|uniref:TauD/TfdA family dioxygenase n=1 Tax=Streptomyces sp. NPDC053048 TaxID=3365694 RepID=UPI0037CF806F
MQCDGRIRIRVRCNARRNETAAELTGEALPPQRRGGLEALKQVLGRSDLRFVLPLEEGDCLVINGRRVLHGRTGYDGYADIDRRRCLVRLMLECRDQPPGFGQHQQASGTAGLSPRHRI